MMPHHYPSYPCDCHPHHNHIIIICSKPDGDLSLGDSLFWQPIATFTGLWTEDLQVLNAIATLSNTIPPNPILGILTPNDGRCHLNQTDDTGFVNLIKIVRVYRIWSLTIALVNDNVCLTYHKNGNVGLIFQCRILHDGRTT